MEMNLVNKSPYLDKYAKQLARPFTNNRKALVVTRGLASDHGRLNIPSQICTSRNTHSGLWKATYITQWEMFCFSVFSFEALMADTKPSILFSALM